MVYSKNEMPNGDFINIRINELGNFRIKLTDYKIHKILILTLTICQRNFQVQNLVYIPHID